MGTYRFVICVDINATNLTEAYRHLCEAMDAAQDNAQGYWEGFESTDEAFGPDNDGAISPDILQNAREAYYKEFTTTPLKKYGLEGDRRRCKGE